ncbi:hypothetical protein JKP88DRAFT_273728 [Tribonema minus]|uniref:Multidrug and toxin extrusion protein n=1 Tax=Tribonema minus TaxID=303371 RepID=A0A836CB64_9STRA|nr:hypothetical protein JKP88DRAFT_273728 [Tribonema minus]
MSELPTLLGAEPAVATAADAPLDSVYGDVKDDAVSAAAVWEELKTLAQLSLPIMGTMIAQAATVITNQVMVGYLVGTESLAAVGVGNTIVSIVMVGYLVGTTESLAAAGVGNTIFSIVWFAIVGASSALDTMGSQSWGAGDRRSLLKWGCVCGALLLAMNVASALVLALGEPIAMHLLGQSEETSAMVGAFCWLLIPGVPFFTVAIVLHKMLQIQGRVAAPMIQGRVAAPMLISAATFLVNIPINALFIRLLGFEGAPVATSVARACMLLFTLGYLARAPLLPPEHCPPLSAVVTKVPAFWKARGAFVVLAMQGALMMGLEEGSFNVTTAFAARLGDVDVAAHAAIISVISFTFYGFPYGISIAASIRVGNLLGAQPPHLARVSAYFTIEDGNLLGAQQPHLARVSAYLAVAAGGFFMLLCGVFMSAGAHRLGYLFTANQDVVDAIAAIAPLAGMFQASLWCVGVLSGYLLAFRAGYALRGLWMGVIAGVATTAVLNLTELLRVDWPREARLALARTHDSAAAAKIWSPAMRRALSHQRSLKDLRPSPALLRAQQQRSERDLLSPRERGARAFSAAAAAPAVAQEDTPLLPLS